MEPWEYCVVYLETGKYRMAQLDEVCSETIEQSILELAYDDRAMLEHMSAQGWHIYDTIDDQAFFFKRPME